MPHQAIAFDFAARQETQIPIDQVAASTGQGLRVWIDLDRHEPDVRTILRDLGIDSAVIDEAMLGKGIGRYDVHEDCLHITVAAPRLDSGRLQFEALDLILAENLLLTLHADESEIVSRVSQHYPNFFRTYAQSLGFLLFEIWDALIEMHRHTMLELEEKVEATQAAIFTENDDQIFSDVGQLTNDLLHLRKNVVAVRDALSHLANHTSRFVAESTQPHLRNMVGMFDRIANDLAVEREILAEALTLYLGVSSHRTNQLLRRLTLISVIFLPLMFLCGIYGMNLQMPEYRWPRGYVWFWGLAVMIVGCTIVMARKRRMW